MALCLARTLKMTQISKLWVRISKFLSGAQQKLVSGLHWRIGLPLRIRLFFSLYQDRCLVPSRGEALLIRPGNPLGLQPSLALSGITLTMRVARTFGMRSKTLTTKSCEFLWSITTSSAIAESNSLNECLVNQKDGKAEYGKTQTRKNPTDYY